MGRVEEGRRVAVYLVQLPSPPGRTVFRDWAGGMGTSVASERTKAGHDSGYDDVPSLTLLYIARVIEQAGISFRYLDGQAKREFDEPGFLADLTREQPRVLVTIVNLPSLEPDLALLQAARDAAPGMKVILLGPTAKWYKERLLRDGLADFIIEESEELLTGHNVERLLAGQGMETLEGGSAWAGGAVCQQPAGTHMTSLDFVDFPAYELIDAGRYRSAPLDGPSGSGERVPFATVFTAKGCPYSCGYCPYPFGFGHRLIYRSPEMVGADIERLVREFGVKQILFRDQVFSINRKHTTMVCEELIRRNLGVPWLCENRYDVVDQEMLDLMYRAGCREIHYGLESADPQMFGAVAKSDGPQSLELFAKVIGWTKARGIRSHTHLIVGMPDESWTTIRNTGRWLRKVKPQSIQLSYYMPYPGTPMYKQLKESLALGDPDEIRWQDAGSFTRPVLPSRHMTVEELQLARDQLTWNLRYSLIDRIGMRLRRYCDLVSGALPSARNGARSTRPTSRSR